MASFAIHRPFSRRGDASGSARRRRASQRESKATLVVGAGGHFCPVARHLMRGTSREESVVTAQEIEFELDSGEPDVRGVRSELPELLFSDDCKGYAWLVRKGRFVNVGLGRQDAKDLSSRVERFVALLEAEGKLASGRRPNFRGHAYTLYGQTPRPLLSEGALLVGDAAGLAHPMSGEGIQPAVESGILAGRAIVNAEGDYTVKALSSYAGALTARFGRRGDAPRRGRSELVPARLRLGLARLLLGNPWFARHVVLDRWFLHRFDAPLAQ